MKTFGLDFPSPHDPQSRCLPENPDDAHIERIAVDWLRGGCHRTRVDRGPLQVAIEIPADRVGVGIPESGQDGPHGLGPPDQDLNGLDQGLRPALEDPFGEPAAGLSRLVEPAEDRQQPPDRGVLRIAGGDGPRGCAETGRIGPCRLEDRLVDPRAGDAASAPWRRPWRPGRGRVGQELKGPGTRHRHGIGNRRHPQTIELARTNCIPRPHGEEQAGQRRGLRILRQQPEVGHGLRIGGRQTQVAAQRAERLELLKSRGIRPLVEHLDHRSQRQPRLRVVQLGERLVVEGVVPVRQLEAALPGPARAADQLVVIRQLVRVDP